MAGRAGRRGMDDRGLVLYLPSAINEPEDLESMKQMMTGKKSTFQSRMNFYYDFLLKTLQTKNLRWKDLMKSSYWYRRHLQIVEQCRGEISKCIKDINALALTPEEEEAMHEHDSIQKRVKESTNASRREAQKELEKWQQVRIGPKWFALQKTRWPAYKRFKAELSAMNQDLLALQEPANDVEPTLRVLEELGFIKEGEVTPLGTMASEINEGHAILEPLYYTTGQTLKGLKGPEEILTVLACFLGEGGQTDSNYLNLAVPYSIKEVLMELKRMSVKCRELEDTIHVTVPIGKGAYWELGFQWVEPVWRWLQRTPLSEIIADYGIFEGNFMRILSKLMNLLEEWRTLATLSKDTEMLEMLEEAELLIKAGMASNESLYLRL
jgi:hypothetical protein